MLSPELTLFARDIRQTLSACRARSGFAPAAALLGSRTGALGYAAGVAGRAVSARRTGGRACPDSLAHPASVAILIGLTVRSHRARRTGRLTWKGRDVTTASAGCAGGVGETLTR